MNVGSALAVRRRRSTLLSLLVLTLLAVGVAFWQFNGETRLGPLQVSVLGEKNVTAQAGTGNSGCGQGNGGPNGSRDCSNPGHPISVAEETLGTLSPGKRITLNVTVVNPNNQDVQLTKLQVVRGKPTKVDCDGTWFPVTDYTVGQIVKKKSQVEVPVLISMTDTSTNQDACKGATIPLTFNATVTGA